MESLEYFEGKKYFTKYCMMSHMQDSLDLSGMNPPLSSAAQSDKELILSYVARSFGNDTEAISQVEVASVRTMSKVN